MRKALSLLLTLFYLSILGCSVPTAINYRQLHSFIKEEKKIKGSLGKKKKILIKDFREIEAYDEDIAGLKEAVEKYILDHPEISEQVKSNLRELKVTEGSTKEEVEFLLGKPDKVSRIRQKAATDASERWIYKINKIRAFNVFIIPILLVHEGYYLYFKDNNLINIERHYLEQIVKQGYAPGVGYKKLGGQSK